MKCRTKKRNGRLVEGKMQEQDQTWVRMRKARAKSLITEIAMPMIMVVAWIGTKALVASGFVAGNGLGIQIRRRKVVEGNRTFSRAAKYSELEPRIEPRKGSWK